jgi:hypothetical protein
MELKKVWMSPDTGKKSRYAWRTLGGIIGIALMMLLLIAGGVWLLFLFGWPREIFSLLLCFATTALAVWLALRVGWRSVRDATIFFLTVDDQLYAMDTRFLSHRGRGILSYAADSMETQKFLRQQAQKPFVPAGASKILKVDNIKENRTYYAIRCQVRHPNRQIVVHTYFLVKGYEDEDLLLRELERREGWENALEPAENRKPFYILLSALVFAGLTTVCVLSHPALARLPQDIYFPCLAAAFAAFFVLVYLIILQRRGE